LEETMKKVIRLFVALLVLGGWSLAASALHVIYTGSSVIVIPKNRLGVTDTYVNVSNWTADDVTNHPLVAKRLIATGKADALAGAFKAKSSDDLIEQINEAASRAPTSQPSPTMMEKAQALAHQASQVVQH
jgi:hypothetical protein